MMIDHKNYKVSLTNVVKAKRAVYQHLIPTNLTRYEKLSALLDADVFVKHENHNPTGSFKIRGGVNLLHHLKKSSIEGVITFSTGNHGLSVAQAATWYGINATIVVPENNNPVKNRSIKSTGATLIEAGKTFEEASQYVDKLMSEQELYYAHPANEPHLINGVGTEFLEIIESLPDLDAVVLPLGAGSEVAAAATVLKAINPIIEIYAVQAECSSAAFNSWKAGQMESCSNTTFAGGFATGTAYETPFSIYKDNLADFVLLSEDEIYEGIALGGHYTNNLLEGAGASTIVAAIKLRDRLKGKKVALQFSGCNASPAEIKKAFSLKGFTAGWVD